MRLICRAPQSVTFIIDGGKFLGRLLKLGVEDFIM